MRFSVIITGAFAAFAMAQSSGSASSSATPTTSSAPTSVSLTPEQSSTLACLNNCRAEDVNCKAACNGVPYPNEGQVNSTTACVANCHTKYGNGTEADNLNFAKCSDDCVGKNYWSVSGGTPSPTGASGGSSGSSGSSSSGTAAATTNGGSNTASATGSSASATSTGGTSDAQILRIGSSVLGVAGFLAAIMAM